MNSKTVTYEKTVNISEIKNKNLFIKFYGAARNTEVFIDGEKVGTHVEDIRLLFLILPIMYKVRMK